MEKWKKPKAKDEPVPGQYSLFEGSARVEQEFEKKEKNTKLQAELALLCKPQSYSEKQHHEFVVMGVLSLYFGCSIKNPRDFLKCPLKIFMGRNLDEMMEFHWSHVQAWIKEISLHKPNNHYLIERYESEDCESLRAL